MIANSHAPPKLTDLQKIEIIRRRQMGDPYKVIARAVGATFAQTVRAWFLSKPGMAERRRKIERNSKQRTVGLARRAAKKQREARTNLQDEIAAAKAEAASAPLYRGGWPE